MTVEYIMSIGTLLFTIYVFILFIIELYFLLKDYNNCKYINNNKEHTIEHIEYVSIYVLFNIVLFIWLIGVNGWVNFFYITLMTQYGFIVLFLLCLASRVLVTHINKERITNFNF